MLWVLLSLVFCWLIFRELRSTAVVPVDMPLSGKVSKPYVSMLAALALLSIWQPLRLWQFQRHLSAIATLLADSRTAHVHRHTVIVTLFDQSSTNIGRASPATREMR